METVNDEKKGRLIKVTQMLEIHVILWKWTQGEDLRQSREETRAATHEPAGCTAEAEHFFSLTNITSSLVISWRNSRLPLWQWRPVEIHLMHGFK